MNIPQATRRRAVAANNGKAAGPRALRLSAVRVVLLVLFLLSVYVEVPLYVTESLFIPSFFTLLVLMPVLAIMYHRRIYRHEAIFVGQVAFVLLFTALLSPGYAYINEKLLGLFQTMVSIVGGILLFRLLGDLQKRWVARVLLALSVVLLAGAFLEVVGVLGPVSDAFREAAYGRSGYGVYSSDERDLEITGFPRPKFFTAEPSYLAVGFFAFVNSWLVLTYSKRTLILASAGTLLMFVLVGSPVLALSLAASLAVMLRNEPRLSSLAFVVALFGIAGLGLAFAQPDVFVNFFERVGDSYESVGTLRTSSENRRIIFPYLTVGDVLLNSPFFGVGISGKEVVERYSTLPLPLTVALGNNALAMFFMYLGFVGSLLFTKVTFDYLRKAGVDRIVLLLVLVLALSQMMGGFETPRFWGYVFLFAGVVRKASTPGERSLGPIGNGRAAGRKRLRKSVRW